MSLSARASEAPEDTQRHTRHCWECQRRRIVCDRWRPVCNKCQTAGIVCPGYDNQKPLTWLAPGRVISRPRKRKSPPACRKPAVRKEAAPKAVEIRGAASLTETKKETGDVAHILELTEETIEIFEAAHYFNFYVYPDLVAWQLGPNPYIIPIVVYSALPPSMRHALVTVALSHRMLTLTASSGSLMSSQLMTRLQNHRGVAIQALNREIATEAGRLSDATVGSILIFLFADVQQLVSGNWRSHVNGLGTIFALRGGLKKMAHSSVHMQPALLSFLLTAVLGNTTSPSDDQITTNAQHDVLDILAELYEKFYFPPFPCPLPLFLEIININQLRFEAASGVVELLADDDGGTETHEAGAGAAAAAAADQVLDRLAGFDPEAWALTNDSLRDDWLLIARIYQSAILLYAACSLRAQATPAPARAAKHRARLFELLARATSLMRAKRCMMWPLVVAGVHAADGRPEERRWVGEELVKMCQDMGTYAPMTAKGLLERFWSSGKTEWDECFDAPYVFVA